MYEKIKYDLDNKTNVSGIISPYSNKTISEWKDIPKEEIAASVFNQMLELKNVMIKDVAHRLKCSS